MNIAWLIEDTGISGLNRAVLALADAMIVRGHGASIVTTDSPLRWRHSSAEWIHVGEFGEFDAAGHDVVMATTPATLEPAKHRGAHHFARYSLGGEAGGDDVTFIGAIVDDDVYRPGTPREHEPPRVLLCGSAHEERRGIDDGYRAAAHARWFHQKLDLIRVSPFAPSREEPLDDVQEFHVALSASEMTRLMHSCDVVLAPHHRETAVSLSVMEAMAAGLPAVLTSIPAFAGFDSKADYALFAPDDNPIEIGDRLIEMLQNEETRERLRSRARDVSRQWRSEDVAARLERFLEERVK